MYYSTCLGAKLLKNNPIYKILKEEINFMDEKINHIIKVRELNWFMLIKRKKLNPLKRNYVVILLLWEIICALLLITHTYACKSIFFCFCVLTSTLKKISFYNRIL